MLRWLEQSGASRAGVCADLERFAAQLGVSAAELDLASRRFDFVRPDELLQMALEESPTQKPLWLFLIELAYVSNRQDAANLKSDEWRNNVSASLVTAVHRYFSLANLPL